MARSKSSRKRIRQNVRRRLHNRSAKSGLRTTIKKCRTAIEAGDAASATSALHAVQKKVDVTAAKGIIPKKAAARIKSRLTSRLNALLAAKKDTK